ncbi:uncharacterized protein LOC117113851 isoform X1 [Anneissia japonica]|uniref:uncharacterized protein LOC117113851 isoform X1 n=1 Tax=Anneissia japonica TaxID=1529436 RepID=UPI00142551C4|nr:uncharacterized protein LOC117113851 isoform X1 [Anneissia japonica]
MMSFRRPKDKKGTLVGEKSQAVYSANWKLDTLLSKTLNMLDTSKRRVSHSIAIDQRIVNKRFQTKLHQSKIYNARMTENRDLLRQLTHRDNFSFNTSVGQDDKYTVKLTSPPNRNVASAPSRSQRSRPVCQRRRPKTTGVNGNNVEVMDCEASLKKAAALKALQQRLSSSRATSFVSKTQADESSHLSISSGNDPAAKCINTCEKKKESHEATPAQNDPIQNDIRIHTEENPGENSYQDTDISVITKLSKRPGTSIARSRRKSLETRAFIRDAAVGSKSDGHSTNERPRTASCSVSKKNLPETPINRPNTDKLAVKMSTVSNLDLNCIAEKKEPTENSHRSSAAQPKITHSQTDGKMIDEYVPNTVLLEESNITQLEKLPDSKINQQKQNKLHIKRKSVSKQVIPSIFGEERKVTIFDVNKKRIENAKFPNRFDNFFDSLKGLENDQDYCVDYYTMRLQQTCDQNVYRQEYEETDEEKVFAMKSVGNISARSMTFHNLNQDFSDYPSQYFLNPRSSSATKGSVKNAWDIADKSK